MVCDLLSLVTNFDVIDPCGDESEKELPAVTTDNPAERLEELRRRLEELHVQEAKVEAEMEWIQSRGQMHLPRTAPAATNPVPASPADKVALFLDLFGTRRSVYPRRSAGTGFSVL